MRHLMIAVMILAAAAVAQEQSLDETGTGRMQVLGEEGIVGNLPLEHTSVVIDVSGNLQRATDWIPGISGQGPAGP